MTDLDDDKSARRKELMRRRTGLYAKGPDAGQRLAAHIDAAAGDLGLGERAKTVSVFWSMGTEIPTLPLLEALNVRGHRTALPVVVKKAAPLTFRAWAPGDVLDDGGFGTSIPSDDAPEVTPEVLFVPLLAFDDAGYRLGYGGGFYDRTLEKLRRANDHVLSVGIAFSGQQVDTVPRGPYDQRLDWIATEVGVRKFGTLGTS